MFNEGARFAAITSVLADLFAREYEALSALQAAGADPRRLPPFNLAPLVYWELCLAAIDKGVIPPANLKSLEMNDGILSVLCAARNKYPGNRDLPGLIARWEEYLADTAALPAGPIKVLFLAANPIDTLTIRIGKEFEELKKRLANPALPLRLELHPHWATEPDRLLEAIMNEKPAVVHFSGHCDSGGRINLEGKDGKKVLISGETLGDAFRAINYPLTGRGVRCVILNACHSDPAAKAISQSVDAVIGTRDEIADEAAIGFVTEFYGALANCRSMKNAVEMGQVKMKIAAETAGATKGQAYASSAAYYDPALVTVHAMKRVNLDRLVLGGK